MNKDKHQNQINTRDRGIIKIGIEMFSGCCGVLINRNVEVFDGSCECPKCNEYCNVVFN